MGHQAEGPLLPKGAVWDYSTDPVLWEHAEDVGQAQVTTWEVQTCAHGVVASDGIPWDVQEGDTQDPAMPRAVTGGTTHPLTASKGWVLRWEERG